MQCTSCLRICRGDPDTRRASTTWGLPQPIIARRLAGLPRHALWHIAGVALAAAVLAATASARADRSPIPSTGVIRAAQHHNVSSRGQPPRSAGKHTHHRRPSIGPEQAAQKARQKFGGRVLNVVLAHRRDGPYYQVKLLADGRVRVVNIDARQ